MISLLPLQVRPLNVDGSLNLLGLETVRLIYFRNKMAGKNSQVHHGKHRNDLNSNIYAAFQSKSDVRISR